MGLAAALATALPAVAAAFDLQGHRGARAVAPENTIAGFRAALAAGVTTLELDTGLTRDGHVLVMHDRRLNPDLTRDARGDWIAAPGPLLRELTLEQAQGFDVGRLRPGTPYAALYPHQRSADGERMPTLDEVFAWAAREAPPSMRFNVEIKVSPLAPGDTAEPATMTAAVLAVIDRHRLRDRVMLQSFDWRVLREAQRLAPGLRLAALTAQRPNFDTVADGRWTAGLMLADHDGSVPRLVRALGAAVWSPNFRDLDAAALAEARRLGLQVVPWTVNEPADIERLLALGVDGLISDDPARVRAALAARGIAPR